MSKVRFYIRQSPVYRGIEIFIVQEFPNGDTGILQTGEMTVIKADDSNIEVKQKPTLLFDKKEQLQELMDELWKIGIRPADIGTPGHLAATTHHLNDMRKLVAKTLGIEL